MSEREDGEFAVGPGDEMKGRFGWTAENWRAPLLRPEAVPENLRDLVPLAERWGVTCDVTRHDVAEKANEEELAALAAALRGRHGEIVDFLYSTEPTHQSDEQSAFQAMLVLELEELEGPGIPGWLEWAITRYVQHPSDERREVLAGVYQQMSQYRLPHLKNDLDRARQLLGIES
jgi:hypothetical protein